VKYLALVLLAGCGDNLIYTPDAPASWVPPVVGDFDGYDYSPVEDVPAIPTPEVVHAACCNGLLHGRVPHECLPPPGLCRMTECSIGVLDVCKRD
jgi:hypothetical protein